MVLTCIGRTRVENHFKLWHGLRLGFDLLLLYQTTAGAFTFKILLRRALTIRPGAFINCLVLTKSNNKLRSYLFESLCTDHLFFAWESKPHSLFHPSMKRRDRQQQPMEDQRERRIRKCKKRSSYFKENDKGTT